MSSTRKIEGKAEPHGRTWTVYADKNWTGEDCTLIIGGKAFTEEEHEAEFQRRAKELLIDLGHKSHFSFTSTGRYLEHIVNTGERHGIKLIP